MNNVMTGEKIYSYDLDIPSVTDYGIPLPAIVSGQSKVPLQGARIDVAFAGLATGRLTGSVKGIDYLKIRADGRMDLIFVPPLRLKMVAGSLSRPTAWARRAPPSRSPTCVKTSASRRRQKVIPGLIRDKFGRLER